MIGTVLLALTLPLPPSLQATGGEDTLSRLRTAHRARPDDLQVAAELGLRLYQLDDTSLEAQRLLEAASARFPKRRDVQLALLDSYLAAGDSAAAATLLARLEPELDQDERFALDTAYCLLGRRRFPEARTEWSRVAGGVQESLQRASGQALTPEADRALKRRVAEVLFIQGLLTARLGEKDEALRLLGQADGYGFPPLDSPLMMAAGDCLSELQEHALATQAYAEVVKHAPENREARLRLGVSLYASGHLREAREELERVLRQDPHYPRANYHLGTVLFEQKQTAEAQGHLERELARDARCVRCMARLAHIAYLRGDDPVCESWLEKAAALDPGNLEADLVSGMLALRSGRYDRAIQQLTRVVERSPESTKARYQLALAYQRSGNAEKAREHRQIYDELIREEKARTIGVRGTEGD
jgi:tetratricopeptide (TPR) repeat protein